MVVHQLMVVGPEKMMKHQLMVVGLVKELLCVGGVEAKFGQPVGLVKEFPRIVWHQLILMRLE